MTKSIDFGFFMKYRKLQCLNLLSSKWKTKHSLFWRKEITLFFIFFAKLNELQHFLLFLFLHKKMKQAGAELGQAEP